MLRCGVPQADAAKIAELMLEADLVGADAHGVFRLPQYVRRHQGRRDVNPKRQHQGRKDRARRPRMVDGDNGMGHLVMRAPPRPRSSWRKRDRRRLGRRAGAPTMPARPASMRRCRSRQDMVGIYAVVANANHMPVWGGAESCSAPIRWRSRFRPARSRRWCSTSRPRWSPTARSRPQAAGQPTAGRLDDRQARRAGDRSAEERRGAAVADRRPQGLGLALVLGLLARHTQRRGCSAATCVDFNARPDRPCNTGQFIVALDSAVSAAR